VAVIALAEIAVPASVGTAPTVNIASPAVGAVDNAAVVPVNGAVAEVSAANATGVAPSANFHVLPADGRHAEVTNSQELNPVAPGVTVGAVSPPAIVRS
jgi:hypothetical protein